MAVRKIGTGSEVERRCLLCLSGCLSRTGSALADSPLVHARPALPAKARLRPRRLRDWAREWWMSGRSALVVRYVERRCLLLLCHSCVLCVSVCLSCGCRCRASRPRGFTRLPTHARPLLSETEKLDACAIGPVSGCPDERHWYSGVEMRYLLNICCVCTVTVCVFCLCVCQYVCHMLCLYLNVCLLSAVSG